MLCCASILLERNIRAIKNDPFFFSFAFSKRISSQRVNTWCAEFFLDIQHAKKSTKNVVFSLPGMAIQIHYTRHETTGETPDLFRLKSKNVQTNPRERTQRDIILLKFFFNNFNVGLNLLWSRCVCMNIALLIKAVGSVRDQCRIWSALR